MADDDIETAVSSIPMPADGVKDPAESTVQDTQVPSSSASRAETSYGRRSANMHHFYPEIHFPGEKSVHPSPCDEEWGARHKAILPSPQERPEDEVADSKEETSGVFSTQVEEEVFEQAKQRQEQTESVSSDHSRFNMQELIWEKTQQHLESALRFMANEEYDAAVRVLNKAIHFKPDLIELYIHRAEAFLRLTDFQSAILNYKHACVMDPNQILYYNRLAFVYYLQGQCLFDQKLYPEALEAFSRATEMRPDVTGYHLRSIACLGALQRHGECLALVNKQLEAEQDNADLYIMRARLHKLFKNTTLCYYDVKDALAIDPIHPEALHLMNSLESQSLDLRNEAMKLNLLGRYRDALQKISLAIETNPSLAEFHVLRGALHRRLGDFNAAIDDYLLALDKTDHDETSPLYRDTQRQLLLTYNDFAVECFTKNYFEEAIILLNKAIKGEKNEKGLYINRGDCFFKGGNLQFALADYHQALELDPSDANVHCRIAAIYNEHGLKDYQDKSYKNAESRFSLAIQHNPRNANFYISRCKVRQIIENLSGAREDILLAMHLDPLNAEVISLMSRLFPGKTATDVLHSSMAQEAKKAAENLVVKSSPVKLDSLTSSSEENSDTRSDDQKSDNINEGGMGRSGSLTEMKACMTEHDFNSQIASEKKIINTKVKNILHNRPSLRFESGRVQPMPAEVPCGKRTKDGTVVPFPPCKNKKSTGWRQFSQGIGIGAGGT